MGSMIKIQCVNSGSTIEVEMGTSLLELLQQLSIENGYPFLAAYVNNRIKELNYKIYKPIVVRFIDITHFEGYRVYQRTISFVMQMAAMELFSVGGFGLGDYTPDGNLAEGIDRLVLGRWRDHATVENGVVVWDAGYHYTWILSSLTFAVTGISGMLAGHILKSRWEDSRKLKVLFVAGAAMVAVALVWSIWMPIVKIIWTSSMALFAAGISFVLMGIAYYLVDCKGYTRQSEWLKVYGMNSIVAYMLAQIFNFRGIANSLFYGLEQYMGDWYNVLITLSQVGIIYLILYAMYRKKIFLKA